jgi:hypothetical protein
MLDEMFASWMLRLFASMVVTAQMSSAFRKGMRGAVQSSTEPKAILAEPEQAIGGQEWATHELHEIETDLKVTFKALPKNGRGAVEAPSVRYALHRFFIQRHGWMVKGLETGGGAWDADSPIGAMNAHVPREIRELFEDRLGNYGLNLHELAVPQSFPGRGIATRDSDRDGSWRSFRLWAGAQSAFQIWPAAR